MFKLIVIEEIEVLCLLHQAMLIRGCVGEPTSPGRNMRDTGYSYM